MTIRSKRNARPKFPKKQKIQSHNSRLSFNFSFMTKANHYNLDKNNNHVDEKIRLKLLEKIMSLSEADKVVIANRHKSQGLELIPEDQVKLQVNSEFKSSGRYDDCEDDYWFFRLSKKGRVIGKISENIFYILAIDPKFDLYKH